jgi:hypothetical protein
VLWEDETGKWKSVPEEIEAYISLWLFEFKPIVDSDSLSYPQSCRLGARVPGLESDLRRWGGPEVESIFKKLEDKRDNLCRWASPEAIFKILEDNEKDFILPFKANLPTLCTHQLVFRFLQTVISDNIFGKINGDGII